jgi:hypothetical protein
MPPVVVVKAFPFVKRRLSLEPGATVAADDPTFQLPVAHVPLVPVELPVQTYWTAFAFGVKNNDSPRKIAPRGKFEFNFLFILFGLHISTKVQTNIPLIYSEGKFVFYYFAH